MFLENLIFSDTKSARDPRNRRKETVRGRGAIERDVVAVRETVSVVNGSI